MRKLTSLFTAAAVIAAAVPMCSAAEEAVTFSCNGKQISSLTIDLDSGTTVISLSSGDYEPFYLDCAVEDESVVTAERYGDDKLFIRSVSGGETVLNVTAPDGTSVKLPIRVNTAPYFYSASYLRSDEAGEYLAVPLGKAAALKIKMLSGGEPVVFSVKDEGVAVLEHPAADQCAVYGYSQGETELTAELPDGTVMSIRIMVGRDVMPGGEAVPPEGGDMDTVEYSTEQELLDLLVSPDGSFSGGEAIDGTRYKTAAKLNAGAYGRTDFLIVYGLKNEEEGWQLINEMAERGFGGPGSPEFYSGWTTSFNRSAFNVSQEDGHNFIVLFFLENELPGFMEKIDLLEASKCYGFDIAPYIYSEITPGDLDGDENITAADGSVVLSAYTELSTGADLELNQTAFDYNSDGAVDAADSSDILDSYVNNMTE